MDSNNYMSHLKTLKSSVEALEAMTEPDVDRIMPLVTDGMEAYKHMKDRIDTVRQKLAKLRDES